MAEAKFPNLSTLIHHYKLALDEIYANSTKFDKSSHLTSTGSVDLLM